MAYLKKWSSRSNKDLELRVPKMVEGHVGQTFQGDIFDVTPKVNADLAYLDPPYNQHKYIGNYHIWETFCRWDKPESYGKAMKRVDCRERKSPFNSRPKFKDAFDRLIESLNTKHIVVSFSNESYISKDEVITTLVKHRGIEPTVYTRENYKRYVGAKIGIHSPNGEKTGEVSHTECKEYLFVVKEG